MIATPRLTFDESDDLPEHGPGHAEQPLTATVQPNPMAPEDLESVLARVRAGDREAAAELMQRYGPILRRRFRHKLGRSLRRLFDSQELSSTVARRFDQFVRSGKVRAETPGQLVALLEQIANNALARKIRVMEHLKQLESGEDSPLASALLQRLNAADQSGPDQAELEIDRLLRSLESPEEREMLSLWLGGASHGVIAAHLDISPAAARKRWERLRQRLRELIEEPAS
ncbi:MAG: hypothetical protein JJU33_13865 [Phycisphaerales bacterium]|nr:hypothetical protein [Phycisphaerales bacterium]